LPGIGGILVDMAESYTKLSRWLLAGLALFGVLAWLFVTVFAPQYHPVLIAGIFLLLFGGILGGALIRKLRGNNG
jgi:hypothetical protein